MTNWLGGKRIKDEVLNNERAEYGKQVIKHLAEKLTKKQKDILCRLGSREERSQLAGKTH